ncbi:pyroglutamyl-peptidase I family protein [Arenibaculum pallidiluteum]|uniref:pyroglutamyl-peptidase I family protein n=1 Tax=Arenibaculum pallidiluteum TaxID=2812559 RepID=UPI001A96BC91|nr:pyroglutamyl-peptidase I [Arenibaculum pallidiluteum]
MILVTGFEAFAEHAANPTSWLIGRLAGTPGIAAAVLPVTWEGSVARLAELVELHRPRAVVSFGLSFSTDRIAVERVALNLDESDRPDNSGEFRRGRMIAPEAPAALWSTLPVEAIVDSLAAAELPAGASAHAGTYVCNHLFFSARRRWPDLPVGFVHVPPFPDAVAGLPGRAGLDAAALERGARLVVAVVRDAVSG